MNFGLGQSKGQKWNAFLSDWPIEIRTLKKWGGGEIGGDGLANSSGICHWEKAKERTNEQLSSVSLFVPSVCLPRGATRRSAKIVHSFLSLCFCLPNSLCHCFVFQNELDFEINLFINWPQNFVSFNFFVILRIYTQMNGHFQFAILINYFRTKIDRKREGEN